MRSTRVVRYAGALRIDHAMSLFRLFWIAENFGAADGVYVRYPFHAMLNTLAAVSQARHTIIIGEDLGVVPSGFREAMRQSEIQSYRVFFFEKTGDEFYFPPEHYPREALACVSIHDLHTLAGWWSGHDIDVREKIGMIAETSSFRDARAHRAHQRRRALGLLAEKGSCLPKWRRCCAARPMRRRSFRRASRSALHRLIARTPSRLFVVQAEDLTGAARPGEHPRHDIRAPELAAEARRSTWKKCPKRHFSSAITAALREERPKRA